MAISADLFRAILAMDAYNRGYNAGIKSENAGPNEGLTGSMIGTATVGTASSSALGSAERNASFFAQAYSWNGKTVISYRGTDDTGSDASSGYGIGLGLSVGTGNAGTAQGRLAIEFYKAVSNTPGIGAVELTGHSLGGGLAGLVAGIYGKEARIFDQMPFTVSAVNTVNAAYNSPIGSDVRMLLYDDPNPAPTVFITDFSKITASFIRPAEGMPWTNTLGYFNGVELGITTIDYKLPEDTPLSVTWNNMLGQRHDAALNVIRMFFDGPTVSGDWQYSSKYFLPVLFDDSIGRASGFKDTGVDNSGSWNAAAKMMGAIAYSAIDEGTRVFGDTGIRAMFNDANDLGAALAQGTVAQSLKDSAGALSQILVQYAGQLAIKKVLQSSTEATLNNVLNGVLSLSADSKTLTVDFSDALWRVGLTTNEVRPAIIGRDAMVDKVLAGADTGSNGVRQAFQWLWNSADTSNIDRFTLQTQTGAITTTLPNRTSTPITLPAGVTAVTLSAFGDGNDQITGSAGADLIYGGNGGVMSHRPRRKDHTNCRPALHSCTNTSLMRAA